MGKTKGFFSVMFWFLIKATRPYLMLICDDYVVMVPYSSVATWSKMHSYLIFFLSVISCYCQILKKKGSSSFLQRLERCGPITVAVQLRVRTITLSHKPWCLVLLSIMVVIEHVDSSVSICASQQEGPNLPGSLHGFSATLVSSHCPKVGRLDDWTKMSIVVTVSVCMC